MRVSGRVVLCLLLVVGTVGNAVLRSESVLAAQITSRSLTLQSGVSDDGAKPGGVVKHLFNFTVPSSNSVGSIQLLYCTTASGTCTMPTGLITTSATLGLDTGAITGLSIVNTTNGAPYLTRSAER